MVNIFGPSTAGKSTLARLIEDRIDRLYTVDFDVIKRQLSGYHWRRDSEVAAIISLGTLESVARIGLPILSSFPAPDSEATYNRIADAARRNDYKIVNIEITAPNDVLVARYEDRLRRIKESGTNWKFKTLDEFKQRLLEPYYRPEGSFSFDSSKMSPDEILAAVDTILQQRL